MHMHKIEAAVWCPQCIYSRLLSTVPVYKQREQVWRGYNMGSKQKFEEAAGWRRQN